MDHPAPLTRELALRLLALEAAGQPADETRTHEAVRVCEKLRVSLTRFAGPDGFAALLRRAVSLARASDPSLSSVQLNPSECMRDLELLAADASEAGTEAAVAIIAYLLELLVTFIGKPLTVRLVRDAWPAAELGPLDD
jgi:hypothetical protein